MRIRLLGRPAIETDAGEGVVRGLQAWAVLARVLLSSRPVPRRQLAAELFPETVDPLGALRWCLASLRRALGPETMTGDPIVANLPEGCWVDVLAIEEAEFDPLTAGELLEDSATDAGGSDFETWLLVERSRLAARVDARLRRDTLDAFAQGDAARALVLAGRAVQRQPYDEGAHVHLIRALVLSGQPEAARAHALRIEAEFMRELGTAPSVALRSAARAGLADPPLGPDAATVVRTLLQSGTAALNVGAVDAGLDCLRRAAVAAEAQGDLGLRAEVLAALGTALVHSVRGQDDEGILHLKQAEEFANQSQNRVVACRAVLELSYADALAGRRPDAQRLAERSLILAGGDPALSATAQGFAGFNLMDWGRHAEADLAYEAGLAATKQAGTKRREGWILGLAAWGKLRAGKLDFAADWARQSMAISDQLEWLSFRPWPEIVLAEAEVLRGKAPSVVRDGLHATLAMAGQLNDPCWQAGACRAIALTYERDREPEAALHWLDQALAAFATVSDPYAALLVRIMLDRTRITLTVDREEARARLRKLLVTAARLHAEAELDEAMELRATIGAA